MSRLLTSFRPAVTMTLGYLLAVSGAQTDGADSPSARPGHWPQFRGPMRENVSTETGLLPRWPAEGPPLLWSVKGLGAGVPSVSVANGRIITIGEHESGEYAIALREGDARPLWTQRIGPPVRESSLMRWLNHRTPTIDGDRLYVVHPEGNLVCLNATDGRELWTRSYRDDFGGRRPSWGFCDHPLVDGDRLICTPGGAGAALVALDKRTGNTIWKCAVPGNPSPAYSATVSANLGATKQYIRFLSQGLVGVAADDGRLLWTYSEHSNGIANSFTPIVRGDRVISPNGYGTGLAVLKITAGDNRFVVEPAYYQKFALDAFQDNAVLSDDLLFTLAGPALICVGWEKGNTVWKSSTRMGVGKTAMTLADGCLYALSADGSVVLAAVDRTEYRELGRFTIPDPQRGIGATIPVVAGRKLYLRNDDRLFCYDVAASAADGPRPVPALIALTVPIATGDSPAVAELPSVKDRGPDAIFVPTPHDVVERMLDLAGIQKKDVVYDLGSGDGRIVIAAAKKHGCRAFGCEIDPELVKSSRNSVQTAKLGDLVTIEPKDLFDVDLSQVDVVTVYLPPKLLERLLPQLNKLRPGARIVSHEFEIPGIKPERTIDVESLEDGGTHRILLWTSPLRK